MVSNALTQERVLEVNIKYERVIEGMRSGDRSKTDDAECSNYILSLLQRAMKRVFLYFNMQETVIIYKLLQKM